MNNIKVTLYNTDLVNLLKSTDEEVVSTAKFIIRHNLIQDIHKCFKKFNMQLTLTSELDDALINAIDISVDDYLHK